MKHKVLIFTLFGIYTLTASASEELTAPHGQSFCREVTLKLHTSTTQLSLRHLRPEPAGISHTESFAWRLQNIGLHFTKARLLAAEFLAEHYRSGSMDSLSPEVSVAQRLVAKPRPSDFKISNPEDLNAVMDAILIYIDRSQILKRSDRRSVINGDIEDWLRSIIDHPSPRVDDEDFIHFADYRMKLVALPVHERMKKVALHFNNGKIPENLLLSLEEAALMLDTSVLPLTDHETFYHLVKDRLVGSLDMFTTQQTFIKEKFQSDSWKKHIGLEETRTSTPMASTVFPKQGTEVKTAHIKDEQSPDKSHKILAEFHAARATLKELVEGWQRSLKQVENEPYNMESLVAELETQTKNEKKKLQASLNATWRFNFKLRALLKAELAALDDKYQAERLKLQKTIDSTWNEIVKLRRLIYFGNQALSKLDSSYKQITQDAQLGRFDRQTFFNHLVNQDLNLNHLPETILRLSDVDRARVGSLGVDLSQPFHARPSVGMFYQTMNAYGTGHFGRFYRFPFFVFHVEDSLVLLSPSGSAIKMKNSNEAIRELFREDDYYLKLHYSWTNETFRYSDPRTQTTLLNRVGEIPELLAAINSIDLTNANPSLSRFKSKNTRARTELLIDGKIFTDNGQIREVNEIPRLSLLSETRPDLLYSLEEYRPFMEKIVQILTQREFERFQRLITNERIHRFENGTMLFDLEGIRERPGALPLIYENSDGIIIHSNSIAEYRAIDGKTSNNGTTLLINDKGAPQLRYPGGNEGIASYFFSTSDIPYLQWAVHQFAAEIETHGANFILDPKQIVFLYLFTKRSHETHRLLMVPDAFDKTRMGVFNFSTGRFSMLTRQALSRMYEPIGIEPPSANSGPLPRQFLLGQ